MSKEKSKALEFAQKNRQYRRLNEHRRKKGDLTTTTLSNPRLEHQAILEQMKKRSIR